MNDNILLFITFQKSLKKHALLKKNEKSHIALSKTFKDEILQNIDFDVLFSSSFVTIVPNLVAESATVRTHPEDRHTHIHYFITCKE